MLLDQSPVPSPIRPGYAQALRMLTADSTPEEACAVATDAEQAGRLVTVCAWCIAPEVKRAVAGFANLSHGCCIVCASEQMALLGEGTEGAWA